MTPRLPSTRKARRAALGAELKRLGQLAGVSGRQVAQALNVNQSAVSRIQSGDRPLSMPELRQWAALVGADPDTLTRLEWMAEQALTEAVPLTALRATAGPAGIQDDIFQRLELGSRLIVAWCPSYLTGLLQTPEYARRLYALFTPPGEVGAAVTARMARQQVLWDPGRRFEFILTEAALRWRTGDRGFLVPQLDRVAAVAALPNVAVSVIPSDADQRTVPLAEFVLYDERDDGEPIAALELLHDSVETANVKPYREELDLLHRSALSGDEAVAFIRDLSGRLA